jgi:hypothetical protein
MEIIKLYIFIDYRMPYCCVKNCSNSWKKGYSLHYIPKDPEKRQQWIENIARPDLDESKNHFVCEVSFIFLLFIIF